MTVRRNTDNPYEHLFVGNYVDHEFYQYIYDLSDTQIAWEGMRRNHEYQRDYFKISKQRERVVRDENLLIERLNAKYGDDVFPEYSEDEQQEIQHVTNPDSYAHLYEKWGIRFFEDPFMPGLMARPLWDAQLDSTSVEYEQVQDENWRGRSRDLREINLPNATVIDQDGYHTEITTPSGKVRFHGKSFLCADANEHFQLSTNPLLPETRQENAMARANAVFRGSPPRKKRKKSRKKYVDMFRAWDGLQRDATHEEIAIALVGAETVRMQWNDYERTLKKRISRLTKRAEEFVHGRYKSLLLDADD